MSEFAPTEFLREYRLRETAEVRALRALLAMHAERRRARPNHWGSAAPRQWHCEVCGEPIRQRSRRCMTHRIVRNS